MKEKGLDARILKKEKRRGEGTVKGANIRWQISVSSGLGLPSGRVGYLKKPPPTQPRVEKKSSTLSSKKEKTNQILFEDISCTASLAYVVIEKVDGVRVSKVKKGGVYASKKGGVDV